MPWANTKTKTKIDSIACASIGNLIAFNIIAGSGFLFFESARNYPITLQVLCGVFFLWCLITEVWFIVSSWRVLFRHADLFAVALAIKQPQVPLLIRPFLFLWWGFHFLTAMVWGIVLTVFETSLPAYTSLIIAVIISGFAYITFGYIMLTVTIFTKNQEIITKVWGWRTRWALTHGIIIIATKVFIAPHIELQ